MPACAPKSEKPADALEQVLLDGETLAALIETHNRRVELLGKLYAPGVIEFRWLDEDGDEHFEPQVDARLRIERPRRSALRASKIGEELLWIGSDDERWWLFDLMNDEKVLYVGHHDDAPIREDGSPLLIAPLALMDLLALTPLPAMGSEGAAGLTVRADSERGAWVITAEGAGGPMRLWLDQSGGLPMRVEALNEAGEISLFSELGRLRSVYVAGVSRAGLPRMPTMIDIADPAGTLKVKLALDEPTGDIGDRPWERFFDLARLMKAMRPDVVEGTLPPEIDAP